MASGHSYPYLEKIVSFDGDRSCRYPEESVMKAVVESCPGLHRRIQHLVDTPDLLGPRLDTPGTSPGTHDN